MPVVFAARRLQPHDKERYIALRMPIVAPGKFAYLPFAGAMQDSMHRDFVLNRDTLSSVAQLVTIAFLEHRLASPVSVKDASDLLGFSTSIQTARGCLGDEGKRTCSRRNNGIIFISY